MSVPRSKATFGRLLREHRLAAGLTQEALSERSGVSPRTIQEVEAGTVRPRRSTVLSLAQALGLLDAALDELLVAVAPRSVRSAGPPADAPDRQDAPDVLPVPLLPAEHVDREPALVALPRPAPTNIPWPVSSLLGREAELAAIRDLIAEQHQRLVTLTGVGGSGKTRLAVQVAAELLDEFADGVWFVDLTPTSSPALVPRSVAGALGVREVQDAPILDALLGFLRRKRLLLVLDNCEHLIDACAALAERLLTACPDLHILATSREPLQITGEQRRQVQALAVPALSGPISLEALAGTASVRLFVERAQAIDAEFRLTTANSAAVAQICARLDGIPLAIELAASRMGVLEVEQVADRLDDTFRLLAGGTRVGPTRQQTMEAALGWSYDLLTGPEQAAFSMLSTFAGGFDLEAAEAVCDGGTSEPSTLDLLSRLVDKSLVVAERTTRGRRYRLLEPVRQYAQRSLAASGAETGARDRHAAYYAALAERAAPRLRGPDQIAWLDRLEAERDNLRATLGRVVAHDTVDAGLQLVIALSTYWAAHGYLVEGRHWLQTMLTAAHDGRASPVLRMRAQLETGLMAKWQGDLDEARRLFAETVTAARALDERHDEAVALGWWSTMHWHLDDFETGWRLGEESLRLGREIADEPVIAFAHLNLGLALRFSGDVTRSVGLLEESLRCYRALGDLRFIAITLTELGLALQAAGDHGRAEPLIGQGVHELRVVGEQRYIIFGLLGLVAVYQSKGELRRAVRVLRAADVQRESIGMRHSRVDQAIAQELFDSLREQLTPDVFDAAYAAGEAMSLDQVVAEIVVVP